MFINFILTKWGRLRKRKKSYAKGMPMPESSGTASEPIHQGS